MIVKKKVQVVHVLPSILVHLKASHQFIAEKRRKTDTFHVQCRVIRQAFVFALLHRAVGVVLG